MNKVKKGKLRLFGYVKPVVGESCNVIGKHNMACKWMEKEIGDISRSIKCLSRIMSREK